MIEAFAAPAVAQAIPELPALRVVGAQLHEALHLGYSIKELFALLDLCVSSLRRGRVIFSVSFQFQRMIPEGYPLGTT